MKPPARQGRGQNKKYEGQVAFGQSRGLDALVEAIEADAADLAADADSASTVSSDDSAQLNADDDFVAYEVVNEGNSKGGSDAAADGAGSGSDGCDSSCDDRDSSSDGGDRSEDDTPASGTSRNGRKTTAGPSAAKGAWTAAERKRHAELALNRTKPKTNKQYGPYKAQWKAYARHHKVDPKVTSLAQVPMVGRFFEDWVQNTACASIKNRKNRKRQRLGAQGAMNVHAAMQQWVRQCCTAAGVKVFSLRDDPGYDALYRTFTKNRSSKRKTLVPVSFTRDHFMRLMVHLYQSRKPTAARTRLLLALGTSAVARGDEIRDVRLCNMAVEHIDVIGPTACYAVRYSLGDNKTGLEHVPEQKAFIRGRVPEACTLAALGEFLHARFKLQGEVLPDPGSAELEALYLFSGGNAGCCISYANHARLVREALEALSLLVEKVTHLTRIFAAQLLIAMGLRVEDVQRAGGWLKDCLGTAYIIMALSPEALLALAMWRKDGGDFQCFGDPRFHIAVPDALLYHALPALDKFRKKAAELGERAMAPGAPAELKRPALMASQVARVLTVAMIARVQDAIAMGDQYPDNPFNIDLVKHPLYSEYAAKFKATRQMGALDHTIPVSGREQLQQLLSGIMGLQQLLMGGSSFQWAPDSAAHAPAAHPQQQQQQQQQQQHGRQGQQQQHMLPQRLEQQLLQQVLQEQQHKQQQKQQQGSRRSSRVRSVPKGLQPEGQLQPTPDAHEPAGVAASSPAVNAAAGSTSGDAATAAGAAPGVPGVAASTLSPAAAAMATAAGAPRPAAAGAGATAGAAASPPAASAGAAGDGGHMLFTPGGTDYTVGNLPFGYTPQGVHNRDFWHAEEQPLQQPASRSQQQQQQARQEQQPASRPQQQQPRYTEAEVQEMINQALQQQQEQQQATFTAGQVQQMISQALQQQQQQQQQRLRDPLQDRSGVPQGFQQQPSAAAPSATAVRVQQMAAANPTIAVDVAARYLQPFISSNPSLAAAVGSRVHSQSHSHGQQVYGGAVLVDLIVSAVKQGAAEANALQATAAAAMAAGAQQAGTSTGEAAAAGAGYKHPQPQAAAAAPGMQAPSKVPGLSSWVSLPQLVEWYCTEEEIPWVDESGETVLVSRAFYRNKVPSGSENASWCKPQKQRASEYDCIYWYLTKCALQATRTEDRLITVQDAAERLQAEKDIGGLQKKGKMTIYKFMDFCRAERKKADAEIKAAREKAEAEEKAAKAAAAAAACTAGAAAQGVGQERAVQGAGGAVQGAGGAVQGAGRAVRGAGRAVRGAGGAA